MLDGRDNDAQHLGLAQAVTPVLGLGLIVGWSVVGSRLLEVRVVTPELSIVTTPAVSLGVILGDGACVNTSGLSSG